tara:strand:- start:2686 stop:3093 length:408 start_codon:yes stop_codon:yes gene_type:complete
MSEFNIKNWSYKLPKNCSPVEHFLLSLIEELQKLPQNEKLHIILDAREVMKISMSNKMKMDAFWKRYKKILNEKLHFTTLFVNTSEQKIKLDKIYKSGSSTTHYRIILESELGNYLNSSENDNVAETSSNLLTSN